MSAFKGMPTGLLERITILGEFKVIKHDAHKLRFKSLSSLRMNARKSVPIA